MKNQCLVEMKLQANKLKTPFLFYFFDNQDTHMFGKE